ncbi:MAG: response regulator receiver protein [Clostridiales bacterium GWF2_36_10]|nr:MAG: response regulator receiver protein [Clostridiales bacterium GWF2_36_10]HAN21400.1 response regulator receiver protein [Clostridiales bacterium]
MLFGKTPYSVLVVSSGEKITEFIKEVLDNSVYSPVVFTASGGEARNILISQNFDLVIINSPLSDEFGSELAFKLTENSVCGVIILVKSDIFDEISERVEQYGVLAVSKPISRAFFTQAIKMSVATLERLKRLETENKKLTLKIDEVKLIERAKFVLIEYLKMNESQAHKYIEKQAMDMRVTRREVAESIIKTYEY